MKDTVYNAEAHAENAVRELEARSEFRNGVIGVTSGKVR